MIEQVERVEVSGGAGTVIHFGGIVAWAAPTASPGLISFLSQSARNLGPSTSGGRHLADHLARILSERDPEPYVAFAVIGPAESGWTAILHGPVQAWDGVRWLTPPRNPGWLVTPVTPQPSFTVGAAGTTTPSVQPDSLWDLEAGVVPGSGFVMLPLSRASSDGYLQPQADLDATTAFPRVDITSVIPTVEAGEAGETESPAPEPAAKAIPAPEPALKQADAVPEPATKPEPAAARPPITQPAAAVTRSGVGSEPIDTIDLRRAANRVGIGRPPLPTGRGPDRSIPGASVVAGVLCPRGHLNRPGMASCVRCSTAIGPSTSYTVSGSRPALGVLIADDGTVYRLDRGYLAGSAPSGDPTVSGGLARPLRLQGDDIAAAHAEIRLHDWDVVVTDRASPGGTSVFEPGQGQWSRLAPYEPRVLRPGTHVAIGQRIVTYVTPWIVTEVAG